MAADAATTASDDIWDLDGPAGESIFFRPVTPFVHHEISNSAQTQIDNVSKTLGDLRDDRLTVLLGCLLVENAVESILETVLPGFNEIQGNREFTFSSKILMLRAMALVPLRLTKCADIIRQIRNDFSHDLSVDSFENLKKGQMTRARQLLGEFTSKEIPRDRPAEAFSMLVHVVVLALWVYQRHTRAFNDYIRDPEFTKTLSTWARES